MLIFGWVLNAILLGLAVGEFFKFRRARQEEDAIPYPVARLRRRLTLGALLISVVTLLIYWPAPAAGWKVHLGLLAVVGLTMLTACVIWFRDLSETSRAVVEHSSRLDPP